MVALVAVQHSGFSYPSAEPAYQFLGHGGMIQIPAPFGVHEDYPGNVLLYHFKGDVNSGFAFIIQQFLNKFDDFVFGFRHGALSGVRFHQEDFRSDQEIHRKVSFVSVAGGFPRGGGRFCEACSDIP